MNRDMSIEQFVTFAILMENNEGILMKSPNYIRGKYKSCKNSPPEFLANLLDDNNQQKLYSWKKRWEAHLK